MMRAAATGLRCSELCDLKDEDVRIDDGLLLGKGKGGKQRLVPIPTKLRGLLVRYGLERNKSTVYDPTLPWFFRGRHGGRLDSHALTSMISKCAKRAGIKAHTHRLATGSPQLRYGLHGYLRGGHSYIASYLRLGQLEYGAAVCACGLTEDAAQHEAFSPINNI